MLISKQAKEKLNSNQYISITITRDSDKYSIKIKGDNSYKGKGFYDYIEKYTDLEQVKEIISYFMYNNSVNTINKRNNSIKLSSSNNCTLELININDEQILNYIYKFYYEVCFRKIPDDVKKITFKEETVNSFIINQDKEVVYTDDFNYLSQSNMNFIVDYYIKNRKNGFITYSSEIKYFRKLINRDNIDEVDDIPILFDFKFNIDDIEFSLPDYEAYHYIRLIDEKNKKYDEEESKQLKLGGLK